MTTVTWRTRLEEASSERDVVGIVKDYLAQLDRFELTQLPEECRPGKFFTAQDVLAYAYDLVKHKCKDEPGVGDFAMKLATFFSQAAFRLTQVMAQAGEDRAGSMTSS